MKNPGGSSEHTKELSIYIYLDVRACGTAKKAILAAACTMLAAICYTLARFCTYVVFVGHDVFDRVKNIRSRFLTAIYYISCT